MPSYYTEEAKEYNKKQQNSPPQSVKLEDGERVDINLTDDTLIKLALGAHERDVTLNAYINDVLRISLQDDTLNIVSKPQLLNETSK
jgi:predicted DNA-binding antitoxin AbrB/MazE fold protein